MLLFLLIHYNAKPIHVGPAILVVLAWFLWPISFSCTPLGVKTESSYFLIMVSTTNANK